MKEERPPTPLSHQADPSVPPPQPAPARDQRARRWLAGAVVVAVLVLLYVLGPRSLPAEGQHLGWWSLLPALLTLLLVFLTREVITSLLFGIVVGGVIAGELNIMNSFLIPALGREAYATILIVYLWSLGGLIGLWTRTGGAKAFASGLGRRIVRGPRTAKLFAWIMGMIFHQGGTISTILAGTTVRPVTDEQRVSHEELTYVVDSTASPAATVIPFNAWPLYVAGLVMGTTPLLATEEMAVAFFFSSIRYNFYGIFAVIITLLFALELLPWVGRKMRRATARSRESGALNAPGAEPLAASELTTLRVPANYPTGMIDFLLPIGLLLSIAILSYQLEGSVRIAEAFGIAVLSAFLLAVMKGMPLREAMAGFVDGCKGVTVGAIILGLAVTLGEVSKVLQTATFIVDATSGIVQPLLLPAILMAICMAVAFSIGSSWGTYAVVFPLAMPLAYAVDPSSAYVSVCFGAVLGGAVFGDQCSPISDTTILSSLACGADVMDHVTTQLPLALVAAGLAAAVSTAVVAAL